MRRYADVVMLTGPQGLLQPAVAASVTVLGHVSQVPATIYSDDGITVTGNPVITDSNGRFAFYIADGRYDLRITGSNFTTYTLADQELADVTQANTGDANVVVGTLVSGASNPAGSGTIRLANSDLVAWRNAANSADLSLFTSGSGIGNTPANALTTNSGVAGIQANAFLSNNNNEAVTGVVRLASGDAINWRNNAGNADIGLSKNASDVLLYNGLPVAAAPGGSTTQVQFNNAGAFGGTAAATIVAGVFTLTGNANMPVVIGQIPSGPRIDFSGNDVTISSFGGQSLFLGNGIFFKFGEAGAPTGVASNHFTFGDSTTHTISYNSNNNGTNSFTGAWGNTNLTPVTVNANVTTDQSLMTVSVPAGTLNRVGRSLRFYGSGVYSTPAASTSVVTVKVKYGALTLITWTSTALATVQATNNQINISGMLSVQTGGASGVFEPHGVLTIDLGAGNLVADTSFADVNTATVGTIDLTAAQNLLVTIAFSNASASNTTTQRQMVLETVG